MSNLRKEILVDGKVHHISIDSSLDLTDVEITGMDPISKKVVHISLSSLLKSTHSDSPPILEQQESEPREEPLGLFDSNQDSSMFDEDNSDPINDMFQD
jgi:hypothetical protein